MHILRWHAFSNFFPRATSVGFSFSRLTAGVETRDPRTSATSIRAIDSYITGWKKLEKYRKTTYFYQGFQVFGGKSNDFWRQKIVGATRAKREIVYTGKPPHGSRNQSVDWWTGCQVDWCTAQLVYFLNGCKVDFLIGWQNNWLTGLFANWQTG